MTPLFGPLASVGAAYGDLQSNGPAAAFPGSAAETPWWRRALQFQATPQGLPNGGPVWTAPPVRNLDTQNGVASFGPPPAPSLVGTQYTHPDLLFGPFAKLGGAALPKL